VRKDSKKVLVTFGLAESRLLEELHAQLFLPLVRRATWQHGLSKEDAGDVVQEAFVLAIRKLNNYDRAAIWLRHTVDNLCLNAKRKERRRACLTAQWLSDARSGPVSVDSDDD
jgi:DNA-directed RNA polymerase specialized sigma24 family protein